MGRWLWEDISCLFIWKAVEMSFCGRSGLPLNSLFTANKWKDTALQAKVNQAVYAETVYEKVFM